MQFDDLLKIKSIKGSKNFAFEELCCQLASLDYINTDQAFFRKGLGADGGVECFAIHKDGSETGWQAKFFESFGASQTAQLTKSLNQALEKHPKLTEYIVCLPIDLTDSRVGKAKTPLAKWQTWKTDAEKNAKASGRYISITLWQAGVIRERLMRNDPHFAGRLSFFFDEIHFSNTWFQEKLQKSIDALGSRYTPEFNVELPIRQAFLGLARDNSLNQVCLKWSFNLLGELNDFLIAFKGYHYISDADLQLIKSDCEQLANVLDVSYSPLNDYPTQLWLDKAGALIATIDSIKNHFFELFRDCKSKEDESTLYYLRERLSKLNGALSRIVEELNSDKWQSVNVSAMLVYGEAGSGKSHLLADIASDVIRSQNPIVLLLSSQFFKSNPQTQILEMLDLRGHSFENFLGALDAAGQVAGVRSVLMIDALNENCGLEIWREHLSPLLSVVKKFRFLALAVSCRTTYLNHIVPEDKLIFNSLKKIKHTGFSGDGSKFAKYYLTKRNIARPSAPNLLPEFNNPLFLRTCCDSLNRLGLKSFPKGLRGLSSYFDFYLEQVVVSIEKRLDLDPRYKILQRAIEQLTSSLIDAQSSYLDIGKIIQIFEGVFPSNGDGRRSLLSQFESEGLLTVEPVYVDIDKQEEKVRFTFERYSDYKISGHLLDTQKQFAKSFPSVSLTTPLGEFLNRKDLYKFSGVLEALAVMLPEKFQLELPDIDVEGEGKLDTWNTKSPFLESLTLRDQSFFSERTKELVIKYSNRYENHWLSTLISISTEPENKFNARYIDQKIKPINMPERDAKWSIPIAEIGFDDNSPIEGLISWAWQSGFDEIDIERAELAALILSWMFSTSNRKIRDNATKALSSLLAPRLDLAKVLIQNFCEIDDAYVIERLLASVYGAILQSKSKESLAEIAVLVYEWIFDSSQPPLNILIRDYARGIVEYVAKQTSLPSSLKIEKVRPPFSSPWPIEFVSKAEIEGLKHKGSGDYLYDAIVSSASSEWTGDFAKYVISPAMHYWTATPMSFPEPFNHQQGFEYFLKQQFNSAQQEILKDMAKLCTHRKNHATKPGQKNAQKVNLKIVIETIDDEKATERKKLESEFELLEVKLLDVLDEGLKFDYWQLARGYFLSSLNGYHSHYSDYPIAFSVELAQKWVTKRAHKFGWSSELHSEFDKRIGTGRGRQNKFIERIGKKYQWLALYELVARLSDNVLFCSRYSGSPNAYQGAWQTSLRNIDPSLLIKETKDDGWEKHPSVWWSPISLNLRPLGNQQQLEWIKNTDDLLNDASLIDVHDEYTKEDWLVLKSFKHYSTPYKISGHIDSWCRVWCVVLKKNNATKFINAISKHSLIDPHALPETSNSREMFLGEYPWYQSCELEDDWRQLDRDYGFAGKVLPTVTEYSQERGGWDYSIDETIRIYLPAPWLVEKLGLKLIDGRRAVYANQNGNTLFKDPSISEDGPSAALINKNLFMEMLEKEGLSAVWIIAGEKGGYGQKDQDFVGRRVHSCVYQLNKIGNVELIKEKFELELRKK